MTTLEKLQEALEEVQNLLDELRGENATNNHADVGNDDHLDEAQTALDSLHTHVGDIVP